MAQVRGQHTEQGGRHAEDKENEDVRCAALVVAALEFVL